MDILTTPYTNTSDGWCWRHQWQDSYQLYRIQNATDNLDNGRM